MDVCVVFGTAVEEVVLPSEGADVGFGFTADIMPDLDAGTVGFFAPVCGCCVGTLRSSGLGFFFFLGMRASSGVGGVGFALAGFGEASTASGGGVSVGEGMTVALSRLSATTSKTKKREGVR